MTESTGYSSMQHFFLSLLACWIVITFLAPTTRSPFGVRSSPLPPPPSVPVYDHSSEATNPTAGDIAAYNLFSYNQFSLVEAIRSAPAGSSIVVAHQNSAAQWGKTLPVPPLIALVNVRLAQLERGYPYLQSRPALQQVWSVAGLNGTKKHMGLALAGKLVGGSSLEKTAGQEKEGNEEEINAIREEIAKLNEKLGRLSAAPKLDSTAGP